MSATLIALLSVALPTLLSVFFGWLLQRNAKNSATGTKLQALEAQAFEKAKEQYIDAIDWQKQDNVALREEIDSMTRVKAALRRDMAALRQENDDLRAEIAECKRRCDALSAALAPKGGAPAERAVVRSTGDHHR